MPDNKKKKKKEKKKKGQKKYISDNTFTEKELKKYVSVLNKLRKGKNGKPKSGKKQKKIGLTNMISFLNLLHNADREKRGKQKKNLMLSHPFNYPAMIPDNDVNKVWKGTKMSKGKTKTQNDMVSNLNTVYKQLYGFNLITGTSTKLPKHQRGGIKISKPGKPKPKPQKDTTPPPAYNPEYKEKPPPRPSAPLEEDSSSSEDEE